MKPIGSHFGAPDNSPEPDHLAVCNREGVRCILIRFVLRYGALQVMEPETCRRPHLVVQQASGPGGGGPLPRYHYLNAAVFPGKDVVQKKRQLFICGI